MEMNANIDPYPLGAILDDDNLDRAMANVKANKGKPGIDGMPVDEVRDYFNEHGEELKKAIRAKKFKPDPVLRVYIPKPNGEKRPLGIPTAKDRVLQQAVGQVLYSIFDPYFSDSSFGYRIGVSAQDAITQACKYLNEGYEWVVDLDISKFFDTVNQDKLISQIREKVKDSTTLHLIRAFLRSGVMVDGKLEPTTLGVPQGGPLSSVLSLIYLTELDNEMERRGYRFCRYADDVVVMAKSRMAAERILRSISAWIERHLFLKVNATKSKVVRPNESKYLGYTFMKDYETGKWIPHPHEKSLQKIKDVIRESTSRKLANAMELGPCIQKINQRVQGWISYYSICPRLKIFMKDLSQWLRHRVRMWIMKHWKNRPTIIKNLMKTWDYIKRSNKKKAKKDRIYVAKMVTPDYVYAQCMTRAGWYKLSCNAAANTILAPKLLHSPIFKEGLDKPIALIDPLETYLRMRTRFNL